MACVKEPAADTLAVKGVRPDQGVCETDPEGKQVYVIEILPRWYNVAADKASKPIEADRKVFYVGKTGRHVRTRYRQHQTGVKAASIFRKIRRMKTKYGAVDPTLREFIDTKLRCDLAVGIPTDMTEERALKAESALAKKLRDEGHTVFSN